MSTANGLIVAFALFMGACGAKASGPPAIAVDRTVCSHCGMLVSEVIYAAAYQLHEQEPRVFDDIGCLLDALGRETQPPIHVWFQDAAGGGWLGAGHAVFVTSPSVRTPMNGGVLAYSSLPAAERAVKAHEGKLLLSFEELMQRKGVAR